MSPVVLPLEGYVNSTKKVLRVAVVNVSDSETWTWIDPLEIRIPTDAKFLVICSSRHSLAKNEKVTECCWMDHLEHSSNPFKLSSIIGEFSVERLGNILRMLCWSIIPLELPGSWWCPPETPNMEDAWKTEVSPASWECYNMGQVMSFKSSVTVIPYCRSEGKIHGNFRYSEGKMISPLLYE